MIIPTDRAFTLTEAEAYIRAGNPAFEEEAQANADWSDAQDCELPTIIRNQIANHPDPTFYNRWRKAFMAGDEKFDGTEMAYEGVDEKWAGIYDYGDGRYNGKAAEALSLSYRHIITRAAELRDESSKVAAEAYYRELDALFGETLPTKEACLAFQVPAETQELRKKILYDGILAQLTREYVLSLHVDVPDYALAKKTAVLPEKVAFGAQFEFLLLTPLPAERQEEMIVEALTGAGLEVSAGGQEVKGWKLARVEDVHNPIHFPDGEKNGGFRLRCLNLNGTAGTEEVERCVAALLKIGVTSNETCDLTIGVGDGALREEGQSGNLFEFAEALKSKGEFFSNPVVRRGMSEEAGVLLSQLVGYQANLKREGGAYNFRPLNGKFTLEQIPALVANVAGFKHFLLNEGWDRAATWLIEQNPHAVEDSAGLLSGAGRLVRGSNEVVGGVEGNPGPSSGVSNSIFPRGKDERLG